MSKLCKTCNDFCDIERYPSVIWRSVFKNTFENQTLECLPTQQNKDHLCLDHLSYKNLLTD